MGKLCKNCEINEAIKYSPHSNGEFCSKKCALGFSTKNKRNEIENNLQKIKKCIENLESIPIN